METCPKTPKCPLFNDGLLKRQESADTYKKLYCNSTDKYRECKRFIIAEKAGKCPPFVLPNSSLSVDEILERMKNEGLL
jgi:hypothetical protein